MPSDTFTLGLVQMRCETLARRSTWRRPSPPSTRPPPPGRRSSACRSCSARHYFCQRQDPALFDLAEPIPGPSTERLARAARETGVVVVGSLFERRAAGVYHNTAVVFDADGSLLGLYRKMHIPDDPLYYEKYYFTPGDTRLPRLRHAFRPHRRAGLLGPVVPGGGPADGAARRRGAASTRRPSAGTRARRKRSAHRQREAWELIQRSHAVANGVYVAAVNRVGHEGAADGGLEFWGSSFVSDPFGVVLARAADDGPELVIAPCDRRRLEDVRRNWPFLRDRRIDAYGDLTKRMIG